MANQPELSSPEYGSGTEETQAPVVGEPEDASAPAGRSGAMVTADESREPSLPYLVVAFGSSAGGLQPFRAILEHLAVDTDMAFVVVPHLAPDITSHLMEIAGRCTRMPVEAIADGVRPEPNRLYILQPNEMAELRGGFFQVRQRDADDRIPRSIALFFRSLAADQKNHSVGVVLSGADSDGALGLKTIKGEGGFAIVQKPETAEHSGMPRYSIAADHVDLVLSPQEIAANLHRLARQFHRPEMRSLEKAELPPSDVQSLARIFQILQAASGLDLRQYKPDTLRRRIARRMVLLQLETLAEYQRYLVARKEEVQNLQEDVLIGVTRFFRDDGFWQAFSFDLLPTFFQDRAPGEAIRIWSAGCSTGEETYSAAIAMLEYTSTHDIDVSIQVFGTDASARSIEMARQGIYPNSLADEIGMERLRKYFVKVDRGYQVSKRVRDLCIFAKHNLCSDPPFSRIDFLFCRNVMIYFNQALQRQVLATFHYALEPSGYLLLGASETLRDYDEVFSPTDRKNKVYTKLSGSFPGDPSLPFDHPRVFSDIGDNKAAEPPDRTWSDLDLQRAADRIVLSRYAPPGLIVDAQLNVLQARGQTAPFVELAHGSVSWSLQRVLREGLATPVREAAQRAIDGNMPVSRLVEILGEGGKPRQIRVDVLPISLSSEAARSYMILFIGTAEGLAQPVLFQPLSPETSQDDKDRVAAQLRQDLSSTRFHLQSLVEERDTRNQELVSANEEIQSANEELQSANEELETMKEELQSANEELQTVNDELQQRNTVLTQTGNDLANLLSSVNIPLLMLTDELHIRQFTPPMERLLNIRPSDVGRAISEIRLQLSVENIEPVLQDVLETLATRELEVRDREGRWHLLRVRPYRTAENKIEGLVLVLVDIHELRRSLQDVRDARDFADTVVECVPVPVVVLTEDLRVRQANTAFRDLTRLQTRDLIGRSMPLLFQSLWGLDGFETKLESLLAGEPGIPIEFEHRSSKADGTILGINAQMLQTDGRRVILVMMEDITLRRNAEQIATGQREALEREIERTNRTLHRAQGELQELTAHLFTMQEEERRRVARELHDDVAQRLSAVQLLHERSRREVDGKRTEEDEAIHKALDSLNTDVRAISHRLHPSILEDLGLVEAVHTLVRDFEERENILASFINVSVPETIPMLASTTVYRVAQEALRNVAKHAGKAHVKVLLEGEEGRLKLEVRDSGLGYDQEAEEPTGGLGLISMKERARVAQGTLEIQSSLGRGTAVLLSVPLNGPLDGAADANA